MVALTIKHNFPEVQRQLDRLSADIAKKATVRSVNRTLEAARTDMGREIRKTYSVSASYVRDRLHIKRATYQGGRFTIEGSLRGGDSKRRSANVIAFLERSVTLAEGRRRRKGEGKTPQLRFKIKRAGGKQIIRGAFIANKGRTVFVRTGDKRLPVKPVQTIDIAQMFNARRVNQAVLRTIERKFPEVFEREVRFYTQRFGKG